MFATWTGESGRDYPHISYDLKTCPAVAAANYVLVRRQASGDRVVLRIGCVENDSPTLNLAELRMRGARLGANEVHLYLLADGAFSRRRVMEDLETARENDLARALGFSA